MFLGTMLARKMMGYAIFFFSSLSLSLSLLYLSLPPLFYSRAWDFFDACCCCCCCCWTGLVGIRRSCFWITIPPFLKPLFR
ncbi:hypothetical protein F4802DRAFT_573497 [Xylaria palmicola]|nr:hypothetical protein F4802DRAFT_573497 [Xylaria palmicola]